MSLSYSASIYYKHEVPMAQSIFAVPCLEMGSCEERAYIIYKTMFWDIQPLSFFLPSWKEHILYNNSVFIQRFVSAGKGMF